MSQVVRERLMCDPAHVYNPTEAAIHVARYACAREFCKGRRVLDIACGEGYGSYLLAEWGAAKVVGVDTSEVAIGEAQRLFQRPGLEFLRADAIAFAESSGRQFDLIVCLETIEHVDSAEGFLKGLSRLAAEDAILIVSCPNDSVFYDSARPNAPKGNPFHRRRFNFEEFRVVSTKILGPQVRWHVGLPIRGFCSCAVDAEGAIVFSNGPSPYVETVALSGGAVFRPETDDPILPATAAYFLGIWGADLTLSVAAVYPQSMQRYWQPGDLVSSQRTEIDTLRGKTSELLDRLIVAERQIAELRQEASVLIETAARKDATIRLLANEKQIRGRHQSGPIGAAFFLKRFSRSVRRSPNRWARSIAKRAKRLLKRPSSNSEGLS
ncbi:MAG: methyltransferase domain-containing protein [Bradyrhizobium sp.]|nr:MAG: methyltransferase domain-containing protein [Bradyrhizobium sp.]